MTRRDESGLAKKKTRTPEERRRSASKQSRTYRSATPGPSKVERTNRAPKAVKPRKQRQPLSAQRFGRGRSVAALVALGLIALVTLGFVDSRFYVQTADIQGVQHSPTSQIYQQAGIDGYSIFWVNALQAAQRIEQLPYVKHAEVRAALPNRVRIKVEERVPVAIWHVNGQDQWVDVEGVTMPVADQNIGLPVFTDLDGSSVRTDGGIEPPLVRSVDALRRSLPEVNEFAYDRFNGLQFRLSSGTAVLLGKPEGLARRVEELLVLQGSLASLGQMPLEIDWRFEDGYTLKLP